MKTTDIDLRQLSDILPAESFRELEEMIVGMDLEIVSIKAA